MVVVGSGERSLWECGKPLSGWCVASSSEAAVSSSVLTGVGAGAGAEAGAEAGCCGRGNGTTNG